MTKSGRAEKSRTLFAHAVLAQIKEEKLIKSHFKDGERPNLPEFDLLSNPQSRRLQA